MKRHERIYKHKDIKRDELSRYIDTKGYLSAICSLLEGDQEEALKGMKKDKKDS